MLQRSALRFKLVELMRCTAIQRAIVTRLDLLEGRQQNVLQRLGVLEAKCSK